MPCCQASKTSACHLPAICLAEIPFSDSRITFTRSPRLRTIRDITQEGIDLGYRCTARVSATPLRGNSRVGMCNQDEKGTLWSLRRGVHCCRAFGLAYNKRILAVKLKNGAARSQWTFVSGVPLWRTRVHMCRSVTFV